MKTQSEAYALLAPHVSSRPVDPHARVNYDLFADALVWSDELPIMPPDSSVDTTRLRSLLRYRTTLILGEPAEKHLSAWDEGLKHFPDWIGFREERRDPSWADTFRSLRAKGMAAWEKFEESFNKTPASIKPENTNAAHDLPTTETTH